MLGRCAIWWLAALIPGASGCLWLNELDRDAISRVGEDCANRIDDDENGKVDCADEACRESPSCVEATEELCSDGIDNNFDQLADCDDPDCRYTVACFPALAIVRDPSCPALERGVHLHDEFDVLDSGVWRSLGTVAGAPRIENGAVLLAPSPDEASGLITRERFSVGTERAFDLRFGIECDDLDVFHAALTADGTDLVSLDVYQSAMGSTVRCSTWIGDSMTSLFAASGAVAAEISVRSTDDDLRPIAVEVAVQGGETIRCAVGPLAGTEAPTALAFESTLPLRLTHAELDIAPEQSSPTCVGLRGPLRAAGDCASHGEGSDLDIGRVRLARGRNGAHLIEERRPDTCPNVVLYATSTMLETGWRAKSIEPCAIGAVVYDEALGRLDIWGLDSLGSPAMYTAAPGEELRRAPAGVTADPPLGRRYPTAAAVLEDGTYIGWFWIESTEPGPNRINVGRSNDGLTWRVDAKPVFGSGGLDAWDLKGPEEDFSVVRLKDVFVMAYASPSFPLGSAIGLAISKDGVEWVRHANNPILVGESEDVWSPSLSISDTAIDIAYAAERDDDEISGALERFRSCIADPSRTVPPHRGYSALARLVFPATMLTGR